MTCVEGIVGLIGALLYMEMVSIYSYELYRLCVSNAGIINSADSYRSLPVWD